MNTDERVEYSGLPAESFASASVTMTAAFTLSYMATTLLCTVAVPSTGNAWCRVTACDA